MRQGLAAALGLNPGELVAFVGAGGKTTAAWRAMRELVARGERAVFTTTTQIFKPSGGDVPMILDPEPSATQIDRILGSGRYAILAAGLGESGDAEQAAQSPYPAEPAKLVGLAVRVVNRLAEQTPGVTWLTEADGARGRLLKAPAEYEPVVPSEADRVITVAGLDAVGRPLDETNVHRPEIASRLLGIDEGTLITPAMIAALMRHPLGGLKGIPPGAQALVLLTRWSNGWSACGEMIAGEIAGQEQISRVVLADLRSGGSVEVL